MRGRITDVEEQAQALEATAAETITEDTSSVRTESNRSVEWRTHRLRPIGVPSVGEQPIVTFDLRCRNQLLLSTLDDAIDEVEERLGDDRDEWEWGDLKHALFEHALSPAVDEDSAETLNVGPKPMGGGNYTVGRAGHNEDFQLTHGASWRMVIDVDE